MSSKKNSLISCLVILICAVVSIVTFCFSSGPCPSGSFTCDNNARCVPQKSVCNSYADCVDESDEDRVMCGNFAGTGHTMNTVVETAKTSRFKNKYKKNDPRKYECRLDDFPRKFCNCTYLTILYCRASNLTFFPDPLPGDITKLILADNFITELPQHGLLVPNITYLNLRNCNLQNMETGIFGSMTKLQKLFLNENSIKEIPAGVFTNLTKLEWLFLNSNQLTKIHTAELEALSALHWLYLSSNFINTENEIFPALPNLQELYLQFNHIERISALLFSNLVNLHLLNLNNNRIQHIHPTAFENLTLLMDLRLASNNLKHLPDCIFSKTSINALHLAFNEIYVSQEILQAINVTYLDVRGINYNHIDFKAVGSLEQLERIEYAEFYFCSLTPQITNCHPKTDGISTHEDLLSKPTLRYSIWIMAIVTCLGNLLVLWGRISLKDETRTVSMVIRNLAIADIMMGVYLCIIGVQDVRFRNNYHKFVNDWVGSWTCVAIGVLAMVSSEVSMLIMTFISVERFLLIADPFGGYQKINNKNVFISLLVIWLIGVAIAIIPVIVWWSSTQFYGLYSGTCFPLHLQEKYPLGWQYSAFIFIGVNSILLVIISLLYTALLFSIWRTRRATPLALFELEFVVRFFFIVFTDALCWTPIIILKILVFMSFRVSQDTYAWLVVFVLPLNSAINPLLYTFTTPKYRDRFFSKNSYRFIWSTRQESTNGSNSNRDDSLLGKMMPLIYTKGVAQSWKI